MDIEETLPLVPERESLPGTRDTSSSHQGSSGCSTGSPSQQTSPSSFAPQKTSAPGGGTANATSQEWHCAPSCTGFGPGLESSSGKGEAEVENNTQGTAHTTEDKGHIIITACIIIAGWIVIVVLADDLSYGNVSLQTFLELCLEVG